MNDIKFPKLYVAKYKGYALYIPNIKPMNYVGLAKDPKVSFVFKDNDLHFIWDNNMYGVDRSWSANLAKDIAKAKFFSDLKTIKKYIPKKYIDQWEIVCSNNSRFEASEIYI